jgi:ribose/xylose/arabinose/galactoside ABC-type transport system permease subunit
VTSEYTANSAVDRVRQLGRMVLRNAREKNKWRKIVKVRLWMPIALQLLLIGLLLWYTETRSEGFLNAGNITSVLFIAIPLAIAATAQTQALLVGYLDLSVGAMISLGVVIASFLIVPGATTGQTVIGIGAIVGAGLALGLVNAGLARGVKIPSIIATLATLSILDGISLTLRETPSGTIDPAFVDLLNTTVGPVPVAFLLVVAAVIVLDYWLFATRSGLVVRATGFDERSAKRSGLRTTWIRVRALLLSGVLASVASLFVMSRSPVGNAQIGSSYALNSITAAVLGGAALAGGRATFIGALTASVLLALVLTVLPFLGLTPDHGLQIIGVLVLAGIVLFQVGDIKELVKRNFRRARRLVLGANVAAVAEIPKLYPEGTDFRVVPNGRKLIKGGTVLSMDPLVGDFEVGDVLVEDDKIVAVGPNLTAEAEVIDGSGMIIIPGFVDTHRHIWEGILRNIGTDVPLEGRVSYISFVLRTLAPAYRPEDVYAGNLVSAVGAIDAGITCLLDWSHIQSSPSHTDAAVQALKDSGMRSVFGYGFPWWGKWEERQPSWFVRAASEHFSSKDPMLSLALAAPGPEFVDFEVARDHWKLARETEARLSVHVGVGTYGWRARSSASARPVCSDPTPPTSTAPASTTPRSR